MELIDRRLSWKCQVIARMGKWLYEAMSRSYLKYFKPSGLLGAGGWPGAANNDYKQFWHPRFCVEAPPALLKALFPQLEPLAEVRYRLLLSECPQHTATQKK